MNDGAQSVAWVGGAVMLDARLAPDVAVALRRLRADAQRDGLRFVGPIAQLLEVCERVARARPHAAVSSSVSCPVSTVDDVGFEGGLCGGGSSELRLGATEVARRAGVTVQAVTKAARAGRLVGRRLGGRWEFDEMEVNRWKVTRRGAD